MTQLRQRMIDEMVLRGFSPRTHQSYLAAVSKLAQHYHRSPDKLTVDDLQGYFLYLAKTRGLSGSSCRLYLNAIRFLYLQVLGWSSFDVKLIIPKKAQRIPELLTRQEVAAILSANSNLKHRTLLMTCYVCGLRVSELVSLQVRSIDSSRHLLRIEQAKGAKDRQVLLNTTILDALRHYWHAYHPHDWLFYGRDIECAMSISTAQRVFEHAKARTHIKKIGGIHSLRHAYATHQLDAGMPITQRQHQLGHGDIHSTMRYLHWVPQHHEGKGIDLLAGLAVSHE